MSHASFVSPSAREESRDLDRRDGLSRLRDEFVIPTMTQMGSETLQTPDRDNLPDSSSSSSSPPCTYLAGNSLGLQPRRTATRVHQFLDTWATKAVLAHTTPLDDSPLARWIDADAQAADLVAPLVGARGGRTEVAVMQTLSANLHFLMCAFYKPNADGKHKVILEEKAFPSDHFVCESQIRHHGLTPSTSLVTIPPSAEHGGLLTTARILAALDAHADDAAIALLPGIQYYTGELLDIAVITAHARRLGIGVIWDLAHAVGNVELHLTDWRVDAAAWCHYKYVNGGPGCIGGLFVRVAVGAASGMEDNEKIEKNKDKVEMQGNTENENKAMLPLDDSARLMGWWGNDKQTRFLMQTRFERGPGAASFQLSNPSVIDTAALVSSLEVFALAGGMAPLRDRSVRLTAHLERLLDGMPTRSRAAFRILTPRDPSRRGSQLSILLARPGILNRVVSGLERCGVVVDERKPDVIRVAPTALYNRFEDCVDFVEAFGLALDEAMTAEG